MDINKSTERLLKWIEAIIDIYSEAPESRKEYWESEFWITLGMLRAHDLKAYREYQNNGFEIK
ncbi:MAG: hypothetical protein ACTSR3_01110 [Candidatus Helarchaeota archaeon]